jgi:hypothetical protein
LYNTKCFCLGEIEEGVENDTCAKREPNQCDRSNTKMTMNKELCKDTASCPGTVERIIPRIINQVTKFCEN